MAGGRPTAFKPEYLEQATKLCRLGATDKEIADFFGVAESTINLWKIKHEEFSESLKKGKLIADAEIANSLFKRAKGFSKKAVKIFQSEGVAFEHEYNEYYPPDPTSMIYWLKNRRSNVESAQGQRWADKHEHVHGGSMTVKVTLTDE